MPIEGSKDSKKTHLLNVWKQTGKQPKELEEQPECPEELAYVWHWFFDIMSGGGFNWSTVAAWSQLTGNKLTVLETRLLSMLHTVYSSVHNGRRCNKSSSKS